MVCDAYTETDTDTDTDTDANAQSITPQILPPIKADLPFHGVRVLELSTVVAGPMAARVMSDLGRR